MKHEAIDIENLLLGSIVIDSKIIDEVRNLINPETFNSDKNRLIYKTILELSEEGKPIDSITIYESLRLKGNLDFVGGAKRISELTLVSSSAEFEYYCKVLLEKWMLREIIRSAKQAIAQAEKETDVFDITSELSENIYRVENNVQFEKDRNLAEETPRLLQQVEDKWNGLISEGLKSSSFPSLNRATGGIMSSDFIVIYGEEKSGKTTVTERLALDFAFQELPVALFTLEMDFDASGYKALSMAGGIEYLKLRNPKGMGLTQDEFQNFYSRTSKFDKTKIFIDDKTFDFDKIISKMKIWKRRYGIKLFVLDYLGLIEINKRFEARRLEIKHYSRRLKNLCKEIDTPIIAVSQANTEAKTAESIDPLRDCDFALHCMKPIEKGIKNIQNSRGQAFNLTEEHFLVTVERSRHGKNKQNFVCGYQGNDFVEIDIDYTGSMYEDYI